jgi:hypothetical protein
MKKAIVYLAVFLVCLFAQAQAPNLFNYQAILKNSSGGILANQTVGLKFSILSGSNTGTVVYSETQTATTTATGQVNTTIGSGTIITGTIAGVSWSNGTYFLKVELDPAGGTAYQTLGTSQLSSTPYALFANQVSWFTLSGQNIGIGYWAGKSTTTWYSNTFVGDHSGASIAAGYFNTFVGESSGRANTTGTSNSFYGTTSGRYNTTGVNNSFFGKGSGNANTTGAGNTFIGTSAGILNTTADENTFIGYNSGISNANGYRNTFLGAQAGTSNISGTGNVFVGYKAGFSETASNKFYLANNSDTNSVLMKGDFTTGKVTLKGQLETKSGGIKFPDGTVQTTAASGGNQTLALSGRTLSISNGNAVTLPADADADSTNELQSLSILNRTISLSKGNSIQLPADNVNDADADSTNELQSLSLTGNTLSLSKGNTVDLSGLTGAGDNLGNHSATADINTNYNIQFNDHLVGLVGPLNPYGTRALIRTGLLGGYGTWWISPGYGAARFGVVAYGTSTAEDVQENQIPFYIADNGYVGIGATKQAPDPDATLVSPLSVNEPNGDPNTVIDAVTIIERGKGQGIAIKESSNGAGIIIVDEGPGNSIVINHGGSDDIINIGTTTPNLVRLTSSGTLILPSVSYTSDSTKKFNIKNLDYGLKAVMKLRPVRYKWKSDSTNTIGFIAQEVKKVVPEVVSGEEGNMSMSYNNLVAVLAKAIQEQQAEIESLKQKNTTLQGKVDKLSQLENDLDAIKKKMQLLDKLLQQESGKEMSAAHKESIHLNTDKK